MSLVHAGPGAGMSLVHAGPGGRPPACTRRGSERRHARGTGDPTGAPPQARLGSFARFARSCRGFGQAAARPMAVRAARATQVLGRRASRTRLRAPPGHCAHGSIGRDHSTCVLPELPRIPGPKPPQRPAPPQSGHAAQARRDERVRARGQVHSPRRPMSEPRQRSRSALGREGDRAGGRWRAIGPGVPADALGQALPRRRGSARRARSRARARGCPAAARSCWRRWPRWR